MMELTRLRPESVPAIHPVPEYLTEGRRKAWYEDMKQIFQVPWMGVVTMAYAHYPTFYEIPADTQATPRATPWRQHRAARQGSCRPDGRKSRKIALKCGISPDSAGAIPVETASTLRLTA